MYLIALIATSSAQLWLIVVVGDWRRSAWLATGFQLVTFILRASTDHTGLDANGSLLTENSPHTMISSWLHSSCSSVSPISMVRRQIWTSLAITVPVRNDPKFLDPDCVGVPGESVLVIVLAPHRNYFFLAGVRKWGCWLPVIRLSG